MAASSAAVGWMTVNDCPELKITSCSGTRLVRGLALEGRWGYPKTRSDAEKGGNVIFPLGGMAWMSQQKGFSRDLRPELSLPAECQTVDPNGTIDDPCSVPGTTRGRTDQPRTTSRTQHSATILANTLSLIGQNWVLNPFRRHAAAQAAQGTSTPIPSAVPL